MADDARALRRVRLRQGRLLQVQLLPDCVLLLARVPARAWPAHKTACKEARERQQAVIFFEGLRKLRNADGPYKFASLQTGRERPAAPASARPRRGDDLAVKVQVPLSHFGMPAGGGAELAIYDKARGITVSLPRDAGASYRLLETPVKGSGGAGIKAYFNGTLQLVDGHEALVIVCGKQLPAQPW